MEIIREHTRSELCCHTVKRNPGEKSMFHWHENYEICQVMNKPCRFRIDGILYNANVGDIVTISEQTVHQFLLNSDGTEIRIFQFHPKILMGISYCSSALKPHITLDELKNVPMLPESLNTLFDLMEQEHRATLYNDNPYFHSLAASTFFLLQRNFSATSDASLPAGQRNDFYRIVEYINCHFNEDISVNSIAAQFYFSRGKLSTVFKKYSGTGITEYIQALRIKNANKLIQDGVSITQAALSSGFESIRTFNNAYRKVMGITPSEYLKSK